MGTWDMIRSERAGLVDALADLPAADWDAPSLAAGWSVRDVVAHIIATAEMTPPKFLTGLAGTGFKFNVLSEKNIVKVREGRTDADLVATYRSLIDARHAPPGPSVSWLGETIVHGEDIFRALGSYRNHPADHLRAVGDFYAGSNLLIGAKRRIEQIKLHATDTGWTHGEGPEVNGPHVALVMAMCGRKAALDDLAGPGVSVLRGRP
jgi:uncharacterized protein (TIGR03083 family)